MKNLTLLLLLLSTFCLQAQKFEGLALTPPMGWNSWNIFACDINEEMIRDVADAMISSGMKDAGYEYIIIDDCWHGERDSLGFITANKDHFPSGIKALADYIHSKGLKFGIYSDAGNTTCGGRPGSRGHEYQDAITYAQWGVDYLKYDWCDTEGLNPIGAYTTMRDALYAAGRPVLFNMCEWGTASPWEWAKDIAHMWRISGDIAVCYDCEDDHGSWSSWGFMRIADMREGIRIYAGPDHWNDHDMMEIGNGMTVAEDRTHFSLWCMLCSPLIAGNDLRNMSKETIKILTNKDVIAVSQDSLGIQALKYDVRDSVEIYVKPLMDEDWAILFLNRSSEVKNLKFDWKKDIIKDDFAKKELDANKINYKIINLWMNKNMGTTEKALEKEIPSHDIIMVRLSKL